VAHAFNRGRRLDADDGDNSPYAMTAPADTFATPAARWRRAGRIVLRSVVAGVMAAWSLLLIAWLVLYWGILPNVGQWKPQIEQRASAALGVPVKIGAIEVRSGGWVPALELRDVVLHDDQQREALRLPRIAAAVSARSLLALEPRFEQLLIEDATLEVRRDALGRLHVAGIALADAGGDDGDAADWFFAQHEVVVRRARLVWIDETRFAPPLALDAVDLVLRNGLRRHELRLDATPPADWGRRFTLLGQFTQPLLARRGDWRRWDGQLHADLPHADVAALRRHVELPFELREGQGALRLWAEVAAAQWRAATVDLALRDVELRLAPTVEPLVVAQAQGRLAGTRDERGWSVAAENFGFTTGDGRVWAPGRASLVLRQRPGQPPASGELAADRLDLGVMAAVAARLPLGDALQDLLARLAPQGQVQGLVARWDGALDAPQRYQVKARLEQVAIAPGVPASAPRSLGRPGWRGARIDLDATEQGGSAQLAIERGSLTFPGVFAQPEVALDKLSAQLVWRIGAPAPNGRPITLDVKQARFANADAHGELRAHWATGAGAGFARGARFPGQLDLSGRIARGRATAVARYLPLVLAEPVRVYVRDAVQGGTVSDVQFKVKGDIWDMPAYTPREGEFRIAGKAEDVTFAYVPAPPGERSDWPAFTQVAGELVFDRVSMQIRNARARVFGLELSGVNAGIRSMIDEQPRLAIDGTARGPAADLLRFVGASPVGGWLDGALAGASATGAGELQLALDLPLADPERTQVRGRIHLAGNDVRLAAGTPLLANTRARIEFTRDGFTLAGGSARVLGGDASFEGGRQRDGSLRFTGQGIATADGLRRADEFAPLPKLAASFAGQTPYRLSLGFVGGQTEFTLTSPLTGLALDLPAPLGKPADAALPLRVETRLAREGTTPTSDQLRVEVGSVVQAQFVRELGRERTRVLRGGIGVGEPAPTPAAGVHAALTLNQIDVDAWSALAERLGATATTAASSQPPALDAGYLPSQVALRAQAVTAGARRLTRVNARLQATDDGWRAQIDADQAAGQVEWRPARDASNQPARVQARLARLSLPPAEAESVERALAEAQSSTLPALDIVVDDFELRGKKLGRLEVEALHQRSEAGAREWRLNRLALTVPEAQLAASGRWASAGGGAGAARRMQLDFRLDLADSGTYLERWGYGRVLRGGKGRLQGQLSWAGSPLAPHLPSLNGQLKLALDGGQFLPAGPGVGRLLGVLSLQALPRRLLLDFRDVFAEGFVFDNVSGDVAVRDGVARTNNLRMRGLQAAVLMEGAADVVRETQDLRVLVVPQIDAGTAALAYAAINPAVGLGAFVAQMFLRRPLMAASTREFHVHGGWDDPQVDRIERAPGAPLPDIDAALGPPAAAAASAPPANP
jgi:uncharacterized protein (TIGR02099 family)